VYAVVRSGGRQHKVAVGDLIEVDKVDDTSVGALVNLQPLLLVDGTAVTSGSGLEAASVTAEVVGPTKGPKIHIMKYKNKTGYRKRQGHRQHYTQVRVTGIES
jgi:large subunit ribosomal protein L21